MITSPVLISAETIEEAWRDAASQLLSDTKRTGLVVYIEKPKILDPRALRKMDPSSVSVSAMSVADVANTIFPKKGRKWSASVIDFSAWYKKAYARRPSGAWGTYFERIIDFGPESINQLERIVNGLAGWSGRGSTYSAAFYLHLSSANLEKPKPLGNPCLQYIQVGSIGSGKLGMIVLYRSHDYFKKALGNFVGLSRLLHYFCEKAGKDVGPITCMSSYAFLGGSKRDTRKLLNP